MRRFSLILLEVSKMAKKGNLNILLFDLKFRRKIFKISAYFGRIRGRLGGRLEAWVIYRLYGAFKVKKCRF